jgi:hypothetical protein
MTLLGTEAILHCRRSGKVVAHKFPVQSAPFWVPCLTFVGRVKREAGDSAQADIPAQPPLL